MDFLTKVPLTFGYKAQILPEFSHENFAFPFLFLGKLCFLPYLQGQDLALNHYQPLCVAIH